MKLVNIYKPFIVVFLLLIGLPTIEAQTWSLEQCVETAMTHNKKLELGKNGIEIGKERITQIKANLRPKVKLELDYKYFIDLPHQLMPLSAFNPMAPAGKYQAAQFGVPHNINGNIQFGMPLYNPMVKSKIETAKIGIEMAELQYRKSEEQIHFDISNLYYNAQIIRSQIAFIDGNIVNSNKLLKNIKLLHELKMLKGTDVDKVTLQILQLTAKKDILHSKYDQILNGMKLLMGISLEEKFDVESDINYREDINYSNRVTTDIKIVETKNKMLKGELNTIEKSKLPTVLLYGSYGGTGYGYTGDPEAFLDVYAMGFAGVKATYTLFDGNMAKKKKKIKLREIENNELQLSLLSDQYNLKITNAKLNLAVTRQSVETAKLQIKYAESIYNQTIIQQKQSIATVTDVLLADNSVREAQQNYLSTIVDYLKADLELKNLTGNIMGE